MTLSTAPEQTWRDLASSTLHDYSHFGEEFQTNLEDCGALLLSERVRETLGADFQKALRRDIDRIRRRLEADFTLLVVGDFKRGKSTLINALLGQKVASSNVTPETVTINRFRFAPTVNVSATLENGAKVGLTFEDIQLERLEPILEKMPKPVSFLSVDVPAPWLQGVTIVDTPGMGDVLSRFDDDVRNYLHSADSVIYVVSALSPLSDTEERFLRTALATHDFPKLTFVVNMIDFAKSDDEEERLMSRIAPRLQSVFPEAHVFAVSALDELCRQVGADRPHPERAEHLAENFEGLRSHLERSVFLNRQRIQLDRAIDLSQRMLARVGETSQRLQAALEHDSAKLSASIAECEDGSSALHQKLAKDREDLAELIRQCGDQACQWMTEFMQRLAHELPNQLRSCQIENVKRFFPFYLAEVTREALGQCVNVHRDLIADRLKSAQAQLRTDLQTLGGLTEGVGNSLSAQALWSNFSGNSNVAQIMSMLDLTPFLNVLFVKSRSEKEMANFISGITQGLGEMGQSLKGQVAEVYARLSEQILKDYQSSFDTELESASAALKQAQELQAHGASRQDEIRERLDEVFSAVKEARQKLDDLEQRLWFSEVAGL
jgi:hypothetical protein